jgi:hypothetical protein
MILDILFEQRKRVADFEGRRSRREKPFKFYQPNSFIVLNDEERSLLRFDSIILLGENYDMNGVVVEDNDYITALNMFAIMNYCSIVFPQSMCGDEEYIPNKVASIYWTVYLKFKVSGTLSAAVKKYISLFDSIIDGNGKARFSVYTHRRKYYICVYVDSECGIDDSPDLEITEAETLKLLYSMIPADPHTANGCTINSGFVF